MNGVINVMKPPGMTSHDVVAILRRITGIKKIGHTGTLDPNASGVLPVCIGRATKLADYLADMGKSYTCEMTLGASTDTQDTWGTVLEAYEGQLPTRASVLEAVSAMTGEIDQIPPMYSAIKVNGQKLYDLARAGKTIDVKSRKITVHSLEVLDSGNGDSPDDRPKTYLLDIHCSKGTYVRTICHDIGHQLGCFGHMSFLVRTRSGMFQIKDSLTMETLADLGADGVEKILMPMDVALGYEPLRLNAEASIKVRHGVKIDLSAWVEMPNQTHYNVYDHQGAYLGIGVAKPDSSSIMMERLLNTTE